MSNESHNDDPLLPDSLSAALQTALRESTPGDPTPSAELRAALAARLNELSSQSHYSESHSSGEVTPMSIHESKSSWGRVAATLTASGCAAALAIAILLPKSEERPVAQFDAPFQSTKGLIDNSKSMQSTDEERTKIQGYIGRIKTVEKAQQGERQNVQGMGDGSVQELTDSGTDINVYQAKIRASGGDPAQFSNGKVPPFPGIGFNPPQTDQPASVVVPGGIHPSGDAAAHGYGADGTATRSTLSRLNEGNKSAAMGRGGVAPAPPTGGGVAISGPHPTDPMNSAAPRPVATPAPTGHAYAKPEPNQPGPYPVADLVVPLTASSAAPSATPLPAIKNPVPNPEKSALGLRVDVGGQTLPNATYLSDDIQYFPADKKFQLTQEAQKMKELAEGENLRRKQNQTGKWNEQITGEQYEQRVENIFQGVRAEPLSTFSIDVDTASYTNCRRFLEGRQLPPTAAVRVEEFINYFRYDYPQPTNKDPFAVNMEMADCPWTPGHKLLRVGLKGKEIDRRERPESNLVFLVDVSGSMSSEDKLPLLRDALHRWVNELSANDRVTIVTYAGDAGLRLPTTRGDQKDKLHAAIETLQSGGSTHGSAGIKLAYEQATSNFLENGGVNRVLWATDGDLNVGTTGDDELVELITSKAKTGVFLTVLGVGTGNLKDAKLEKMADKGNGVYAYLDSPKEARKVLIEQMSGTTITIAKDVKIQIEFNPAEIAGYRLIGYENRILAAEDFANDKKDAGEIGAGHTVTALYEIIPVGAAEQGMARPRNRSSIKRRSPAAGRRFQK